MEEGSAEYTGDYNYVRVHVVLEEGSGLEYSTSAMENVTPNTVDYDILVIVEMSEVNGYG